MRDISSFGVALRTLSPIGECQSHVLVCSLSLRYGIPFITPPAGSFTGLKGAPARVSARTGSVLVSLLAANAIPTSASSALLLARAHLPREPSAST